MRDVFKRIGGKGAVNAAVDRFYEYMLSDDRVKHFFANTNMDKQRQHQKDFITFALGGIRLTRVRICVLLINTWLIIWGCRMYILTLP